MALSDISFTVHTDECVMLAGVNGSGKSTMIKLLLRLYDATIGEVRINGKNIREYELTSLRKSFGVYFQNGANFDFSLRENIGLDENLDDAVCAQVLERCGGSDAAGIWI